MKNQTTFMIMIAGALLALTETAMAKGYSVPDTGSSSLLLGASLVGLSFLRMFFRSKR